VARGDGWGVGLIPRPTAPARWRVVAGATLPAAEEATRRGSRWEERCWAGLGHAQATDKPPLFSVLSFIQKQRQKLNFVGLQNTSEKWETMPHNSFVLIGTATKMFGSIQN
jgi:hypothetical protein